MFIITILTPSQQWRCSGIGETVIDIHRDTERKRDRQADRERDRDRD